MARDELEHIVGAAGLYLFIDQLPNVVGERAAATMKPGALEPAPNKGEDDTNEKQAGEAGYERALDIQQCHGSKNKIVKFLLLQKPLAYDRLEGQTGQGGNLCSSP